VIGRRGSQTIEGPTPVATQKSRFELGCPVARLPLLQKTELLTEESRELFSSLFLLDLFVKA
jgi:hypothetical protein